MQAFPRTEVGGVSLSRLIIGTNWFLGYSHSSVAKDAYITGVIRERKTMADILEVFFRAGVDTLMAPIDHDPLPDAIREAEDRTGVKCIVVATPHLPIDANTPARGLDMDEVRRVLDRTVAMGAAFCMPHQCATDALVDRCTKRIRHMDTVCAAIRERGMVPGLSTHMPESIIYADESGLDVETYISIYNSMGFLMQVEVDWIARVIQNAKKPVMTIKPMASGQLRPFQALTFVWNSLRDRDMVAVGTMSPREAAELVELSLDLLARRSPSGELQKTRSKKSLEV